MKSVYVVVDTLSEMIVGGVLPFASDAAAIRFFNDILNDKNTVVAKHPGDHILVCSGKLDERTGEIDGGYGPRTVVTGSAALEVTLAGAES